MGVLSPERSISIPEAKSGETATTQAYPSSVYTQENVQNVTLQLQGGRPTETQGTWKHDPIMGIDQSKWPQWVPRYTNRLPHMELLLSKAHQEVNQLEFLYPNTHRNQGKTVRYQGEPTEARWLRNMAKAQLHGPGARLTKSKKESTREGNRVSLTFLGFSPHQGLNLVVSLPPPDFPLPGLRGLSR